jgi:hypothetical protein
MSRLRIRVGFVLLFKNWLWVVDRRINDSWQLRALKIDRLVCLTRSELSDHFLNEQCKLVAQMGAEVMEGMEMAPFRRLVCQVILVTGTDSRE